MEMKLFLPQLCTSLLKSFENEALSITWRRAECLGASALAERDVVAVRMGRALRPVKLRVAVFDGSVVGFRGSEIWQAEFSDLFSRGVKNGERESHVTTPIRCSKSRV